MQIMASLTLILVEYPIQAPSNRVHYLGFRSRAAGIPNDALAAAATGGDRAGCQRQTGSSNMTPSKLPLALSVLAIAFFSVGASASAWAPAGSATIHPGVMTFTRPKSFLGGGAQR